MRQTGHRGGLDARSVVSKNAVAPSATVLIEHPDESGERWRAALDLLLETGRTSPKGKNPE